MMSFFHFLTAWVRVKYAKWAGYAVISSPAVQEGRGKWCNKCQWQRDGICTVCGCLIFSKIMLNTEKCPKNYWHRVWAKRVTNKGMR